MFRFIATSIVAFGVMTGAAIADDCVSPGAAPTVPDGKTASKEEMITGSQAVRQYNVDTSAYLECMDARDADMEALEQQAAKNKDSDRVKEIRETRAERLKERNAAFERLDKAAADFNEAVRDYKARTDAE